MSEFTPEQVERAAEALRGDSKSNAAAYEWADLSDWLKQLYREDARAVLYAAGAPEMAAPVVDEAALADVLWNHCFTITGRCECGYQAPSMNPRDATDHLASVVAAYLRGDDK